LSFVEEETLDEVALPTVQGVDADACASSPPPFLSLRSLQLLT